MSDLDKVVAETKSALKKNRRDEIKSYQALKDTGIDKPVNEDAYLVDLRNMLFGVADGFGGLGTGDVASKKVLEDVKYFVENGLGDSEVTLPFVYRSYMTASENLLLNAFLYANSNLNELNKGRHANGRAGCSVAFGIFSGNHLTIASSGSCCVVLLRDGVVRVLNRPRSLHSMNTAEIFKGEKFDALSVTRSLVPLSALGVTKELEPEMTELKVVSGDRIIFCTDGLYSFVSEREFSVLDGNQALVDSARAAGSQDDIAVLSLVA